MGTSGQIHPWLFFSSQGSGPQHHHQTLLGHSETQDTGRTPWHPEEAFSCSLTQIQLTPLPPGLSALGERVFLLPSPPGPCSGWGPSMSSDTWTAPLGQPLFSFHNYPSSSHKPLTGPPLFPSHSDQRNHCSWPPHTQTHKQTCTHKHTPPPPTVQRPRTEIVCK